MDARTGGATRADGRRRGKGGGRPCRGFPAQPLRARAAAGTDRRTDGTARTARHGRTGRTDGRTDGEEEEEDEESEVMAGAGYC